MKKAVNSRFHITSSRANWINSIKVMSIGDGLMTSIDLNFLHLSVNSIQLQLRAKYIFFNPNEGGLFRGLFWDGGGMG